jgi:hypothetical protein
MAVMSIVPLAADVSKDGVSEKLKESCMMGSLYLSCAALHGIIAESIPTARISNVEHNEDG